jgi:YD repeat-containing protein
MRISKVGATLKKLGQPAREVRVQSIRRNGVFGLIVGFLLLLGATLAQATTYTYDANGRLVAVTDDAGSSAKYVYDALGNLLEIRSVPAGHLAIFSFSPAHGDAGMMVTIEGQGFNPDASKDVVTFGTVVADIVAATATRLNVYVPAGASTGAITVAVGTQSAVSDVAFVVDDTGVLPEIDAITPLIVGVGAPVTISGKHLAPVGNITEVRLSGHPVLPDSYFDAAITFPVPAGVAGGKVTVTTPYGRAVSEDDLLVVPPGVAPEDVGATGRIVADGSSVTMNMGEAGRYGAIFYDAKAGEHLGFGLDQLSSPAGSFSYTMYGPDGAVLRSSQTCNVSRKGCDHPFVDYATTGTYMVIVTPAGTSTMSFRATLSTDALGGVLQPGVPATVDLPRAGQHARFTFDGTAGQGVSLVETNVSTQPSGYNVNMFLLAPDGSILKEISPPATTNVLSVSSLPSSGTYTVFIEPAYAATASLKVAIPGTLNGQLVIDESPQNIVTTVAGQNVRITFAASAGDHLGLGLDQLSSSAGSFTYTMYSPDGAVLRSSQTCNVSQKGCDHPFVDYATTGTYTVVVTPNGASAMGFRATLSTDVSGGMLQPGVPAKIDLSRAGQHARLTFEGVAGQGVSLVEKNVSTQPKGYNVNMFLLAPDGSILKEISPPATTNVLSVSSLPSSGTYTVFIEPAYAATATVDVELQ